MDSHHASRGIAFGVVLALPWGCIGSGGSEAWGACSDAHSGSASYNCTEIRGGRGGAATYRAQCERDLGVYSDVCPAGATPGCCTQGPDETGFVQITCTYNCVDEVCQDLPAVCAANGGTWTMR